MIQVELGKTDRLYGRGKSYSKAKADAACHGLAFFGLTSVNHVDDADKNGVDNRVRHDNGIGVDNGIRDDNGIVDDNGIRDDNGIVDDNGIRDDNGIGDDDADDDDDTLIWV